MQERYQNSTNEYLPPAFRRNGEGTVFTVVCPHFGGDGTPIRLIGGTPFLPNWGGAWSTPILLNGGYPHPS